jgi:YVTN family beta-propeller protein
MIAILVPAALYGQNGSASGDFGNWLRSSQVNQGAYQTKPCIPTVLPFSMSTDDSLVSGYVGCQGGGGSQSGGGDGFGNSGKGLAQGYLASIIPTPGLTSSSVCGTAGVRCAADAHFAVTPQGEALNQVAHPAGIEARAASGNAPVPRPTFRMLPFAPVFPNQTVTPPRAACGAGNEYTILSVEHLRNRVVAIGGCSGTIFATIPVPSNPLEIELLPDGSQAIVTSFDSAISFIDIASYMVVATIRTTEDINPSGIALSPDGKRAYVTNYTDPGASLLTIDVASHQIVATLPLDAYPQSVFGNPDGTLLWVTFPFNNEIAIVDVLTNTVIKTIGADSPFGVAFNSTGTMAFVASRNPAAVDVYDTTTYRSVRRIPVGAGPSEVGVTPDDLFALVGNFDGSSLTVINLADYSTSTLSLPGTPEGMTIRSSN